MKNLIERFLNWLKIKPKPMIVETAWPFPIPKAKPRVKKTRALPSRATVAKKTTKVVKKAAK